MRGGNLLTCTERGHDYLTPPHLITRSPETGGHDRSLFATAWAADVPQTAAKTAERMRVHTTVALEIPDATASAALRIRVHTTVALDAPYAAP